MSQVFLSIRHYLLEIFSKIKSIIGILLNSETTSKNKSTVLSDIINLEMFFQSEFLVG